MLAIAQRQGLRNDTHRDLPRITLILRIANRPILLNNHSPAPQPITHTSHPAMSLSKLALAIAHEQDLVILLHAIDFAPCAHYPAVVARDHDDKIDALLKKLVQILKVRWDVESLAARREGAWDRDKNDFLAAKFFRGIVLLRHAAGGWVGVGDGCPSVACVSI